VLDALGSMVQFRSLCRQAAMKVVARLVEKVDESIRKRHDASREDLGLMYEEGARQW
jgi:hypothetical protein